MRARDVQLERGQSNARVSARLIRRQYVLDEAGERTLELAMRRLSLSARAHDRILQRARTVADVEGPKAWRPRTWPKRCNAGKYWN